MSRYYEPGERGREVAMMMRLAAMCLTVVGGVFTLLLFSMWPLGLAMMVAGCLTLVAHHLSTR